MSSAALLAAGMEKKRAPIPYKDVLDKQEASIITYPEDDACDLQDYKHISTNVRRSDPSPYSQLCYDPSQARTFHYANIRPLDTSDRIQGVWEFPGQALHLRDDEVNMGMVPDFHPPAMPRAYLPHDPPQRGGLLVLPRPAP